MLNVSNRDKLVLLPGTNVVSCFGGKEDDEDEDEEDEENE